MFDHRACRCAENQTGQSWEIFNGNKCLHGTIRPGPNAGKWWLQAPAGKLDPGRVRATSATDLPMRSFTGVNRMEWILPSSGPLMTVAIPEICARSLTLLAAMMKRLESAGISVLRSVTTPSCQTKPWDQPWEPKVLP